MTIANDAGVERLKSLTASPSTSLAYQLLRLTTIRLRIPRETNSISSKGVTQGSPDSEQVVVVGVGVDPGGGGSPC